MADLMESFAVMTASSVKVTERHQITLLPAIMKAGVTRASRQRLIVVRTSSSASARPSIISNPNACCSGGTSRLTMSRAATPMG